MEIRNGNILIRKFQKKDIENKILWINDKKNNTYLHYNLPLNYTDTLLWYEKNKKNNTRLDCVIEYNDIPVGLIGLLSIEQKNKKAEYYICIDYHYIGNKIGYKASKLLLKYAFNELNLSKIYLYTEENNLSAQKLFEKVGFQKEGFLKKDLIYNGKIINRYIYAIYKEEPYE